MRWARGFAVHRSRESEPGWCNGRRLGSLLARTGAGALVLDVRDGLSLEQVRELRKAGALIVALDDPSRRARVAIVA